MQHLCTVLLRCLFYSQPITACNLSIKWRRLRELLVTGTCSGGSKSCKTCTGLMRTVKKRVLWLISFGSGNVQWRDVIPKKPLSYKFFNNSPHKDHNALSYIFMKSRKVWSMFPAKNSKLNGLSFRIGYYYHFYVPVSDWFWKRNYFYRQW